MTGKYTDLTEEIWRADEGRTSFGSVNMVLDYLDRHPDRVPGRTITAGEVGRRSHLINGRYIETPSIIDFLEALGITVVPDPEPTNAEKLASHVLRITDDLYIGLPQNEIDKIAESLDEAGVKAPGAGE